MIRPEFQSYSISEHGVALISELRMHFSVLLEEIERVMPPSRERSLVVTKLQEACMFAVRDIAAANQEPAP